MRLILIFFSLFYPSFCENGSWCDSDECYIKYHTHIENYKDSVNDIIQNFERLLDDLRPLNSSLSNLSKQLETFPNSSWIKDVEAANKSLNTTVDSDFASEDDIKEIKNLILDWTKFLNELNKTKNDVLNIPYSTSQEIDFINSLLKDRKHEDCLEHFHEQLKTLFIEIATFLKFEDVLDELNDILTNAEGNRKRAENILKDTDNIVEKEKQLKKIKNLANETLNVVDKLENIKKQINTISKTKDEQIVKKAEAKIKFENDRKNLMKKYDVNKYKVLLDKLKANKEELENLTDNKPVDIVIIENEINNYLECIDCYQEFLSLCQKGDLTERCETKIKECKNL